MTCQCVCGCKEIRNVSGDPLEMCAACQLCYDLDSSVHHLPEPAVAVNADGRLVLGRGVGQITTWTVDAQGNRVPDREPVSDAEKDAAIAKMIAESGL